METPTLGHKTMKSIIAAFLLSVSTLFAVNPVITSHDVTFTWLPNPADLGGLTTNAYYTNIVFRLYSVTDVTTPTNNWPVVTNWIASTFPSFSGNWTNSVNIDGNTRFYLLTVGAVNGGVSPFSNLAVLVSTPQPGIIQRVSP